MSPSFPMAGTVSPQRAVDAVPTPPFPQAVEFSGSFMKRVEGRRFEAQVYAKPDRLRIEYKYAVRTELDCPVLKLFDWTNKNPGS